MGACTVTRVVAFCHPPISAGPSRLANQQRRWPPVPARARSHADQLFGAYSLFVRLRKSAPITEPSARRLRTAERRSLMSWPSQQSHSGSAVLRDKRDLGGRRCPAAERASRTQRIPGRWPTHCAPSSACGWPCATTKSSLPRPRLRRSSPGSPSTGSAHNQCSAFRTQIRRLAAQPRHEVRLPGTSVSRRRHTHSEAGR